MLTSFGHSCTYSAGAAAGTAPLGDDTKGVLVSAAHALSDGSQHDCMACAVQRSACAAPSAPVGPCSCALISFTTCPFTIPDPRMGTWTTYLPRGPPSS